MNYRFDIDGLRTIAVFLVLLHHFGFSFNGGYVGVDVFFVISGFVITHSYYNKLMNNSFSTKTFFKQRVYRLFPALFFVLLMTNVIFCFVMTPPDLINLFNHTISNFFFMSNVYAFLEYGNYFSLNVKEAPLLHTWSLAVEWQFYILFPFFLLFFNKLNLFEKISRSVLVLFFMCVALVLLSEYISIYYQKSGYYLIVSRAYELLAGCWLALFCIWRKSNVLPVPIQSVLSLTGLVLIFYSALYFGSYTRFPGFHSLVPVLGTMLIIFSESSMFNQFLKNKLFVYLGKCSYSLYLWHWPIVVFLNYTENTLLIHKVVGVLFTLILSHFTYKYVELSLMKRKS
ncbi:acyltransferase family protein [Shewanella phaeophyticola]|uniref:Acyltransferase n=1 Tax=Shewanella phaeophyticola TaxID=2978345 RepID=A0ABT2P325_9GAMM|nr:acyltransferase [Shewanella sp. KJ10-1]MCT8987048.1 acyltransferase [Shewanella sp. KJ10-1]